ncbi:class I SAM-dependent methyltransferase [Pseudonocardia pini]|uniref:class I SAM-dependent methyltransferase n=1 Tax=Pseudonocardia pini TaxID=2758030 RepID=UPI0015F12093|nr:class I SAM-dependent methyltransferase [Pseudonocardia pini]
MALGPAVRTRLGRYEIPAADAYRSLFINLDDCAEVMASVFPAARILEIGCGDGSFAQRLLKRYPKADYVGIDVSAQPGRLFRGDPARVQFASVDSASFRATEPGTFDLVVVVDVIHHVPHELREALFRDVRALTTPGGHYAIKEWEPRPGPAHLACWAADRFITGDRISHVPSAAMKSRLADLLGDELVLEARIPPHRHNYLLGYAREGIPAQRTGD